MWEMELKFSLEFSSRNDQYVSFKYLSWEIKKKMLGS
jgi:hypothetical protein